MTVRTALVTGSSRGIGAATALALARDGYRVIVHGSSNPDKAQETAAAIRAAGGDAELVSGDLALPDTPAALAADVAALCPDGLHALVLGAAVMSSSDIAVCTMDVLDELYAVNFRAPFFLLQALGTTLADAASVVFVSSVTARRVTGSVAGYAALKGAIETLVRRAAVQYAPRAIRVNAVAPGTTATGLIADWVQTADGRATVLRDQALQRIAQPEDIAGPIAFLCSEAACWIDGAVIPVDGGALL